MSKSCHTAQRRKLFSQFAARLAVSCAVVFHLVYAPIHLVAEIHVHDHTAPVAMPRVTGLTDEHGHDHDHHSHHPHDAGDHQIVSVRKISGSATFGPMLVSHAIPLVPISRTVWQLPVLERVKPPGESPPALAQPRAPPLI